MPELAAIKLHLQPPTPPPALLLALQRARLHYTDPVGLYYCVPIDIESYCGVFGDGDNAAYEWFVWHEGVLRTSDDAYGSPDIALRYGLNQEL